MGRHRAQLGGSFESSRPEHLLPALILFGLALLFLLWLLGEPWLTERRRRRIRARPFPAAWREILKRRVPYVRSLPADLQLQLKQHIQVFLAEKPFIGCDGLEVTDEMRVTIAAQACLLLLNRPRGYYPQLRQILVYPSSFVVNRGHTDGSGVAHNGRQVLSGESWSQGQVILSWQDTLQGAAAPNNGQNVVIHEFAHQLDQETGSANGARVLARRDYYARWARGAGCRVRTTAGACRAGPTVLAQQLRRHRPGRILRRGQRGVLRATAGHGGRAPGAVSRTLAVLPPQSAELVLTPCGTDRRVAALCPEPIKADAGG